MVLASNEWLNNCENEQKPVVTEATTATATATATATTTAASTTSIPTTITTTHTQEMSTNNAVAVVAATITPTTTSNSNTATVNATTTITTATTTADADNENEHEEEQQLQAQLLLQLQKDEQQTNDVIELSDQQEIKLKQILENVNNNHDDASWQPIGDGECSTTTPSESNSGASSNSSTLQAPLPTNNVTSSAGNTWSNLTVCGNDPQITENFLSSLGVDISELSSTLALQKTVKNLSATFESPATLNGDHANTVPTNNCSLGADDTSAAAGTATAATGAAENDGQAKIVLLCEPNSHPFQTRNIQLTPNIECKVGRLIAKSKACETNAIFDCKVLSRNHAVLWYTPDDSKFWVKDTKSSNGTFINDNKLGSEAAELHFGDIVKFGVDVIENARKEVHGCIIACVKLYLPDGRESISIDALSNGRSPYSGENSVSYDELHRLNLYVQEVSQREKNLKSKLFNIQNILDATRKNSGLCWQALIAEDQLLHRIHMLEKKLQIMEKNVPESALRNEVNKQTTLNLKRR